MWEKVQQTVAYVKEKTNQRKMGFPISIGIVCYISLFVSISN